MYKSTYLLAGIPVSIASVYKKVHIMCKAYATDLPPVVHVATTAEEIDAEGEKSDEERRREGLHEHHFGRSYLETLCVYRKIALAMLERGVLLMHGSVVAVDGEAYLFTALSGTGKSTHVRLWRELFGRRAVMVNDDKPLVCVTGGRAVVYGTPWDGKHHLSSNVSVPLKAIVYLQRGEENRISQVAAGALFPVLVQQTFRTPDASVTARVMALLAQLAGKVSLYSLHCNMQPEAAKVAYDGMQ